MIIKGVKYQFNYFHPHILYFFIMNRNVFAKSDSHVCVFLLNVHVHASVRPKKKSELITHPLILKRNLFLYIFFKIYNYKRGA